MVVTGRVLGADGKPVGGCEVGILTRYYRRSEKPDGTWPSNWHPGLSRANRVAATGQTDAEGRFRLSGPAYSAELPTVGAALIASAPGHGLVAVRLDHALTRQEVTINLQAEKVARGRILGPDAKAAAGVEVRVHRSPYTDDRNEVQRFEPLLLSLFNEYCYVPPKGAFWPKAVVTDEEGRFLIRGLAPGKAVIEVGGGTVTPNRFEVQTTDPMGTEEATLRLTTAPLLEGRLTEQGTGKAIAAARVILADSFGDYLVEARTDKEGRYAVRPFPGQSFQVIVHPPEGSRCLGVKRSIAIIGKDRQELDLTLPVGVVVRGRVAEAGSGKPVPGARVGYRSRDADNPFRKSTPYSNSPFPDEGLQTTISGAEGRFQLAVPPGPGHLFVIGPSLNYVNVETTQGELEGGKPGGMRYYPHAVVPLDLKPDADAPDASVNLRRGVTLRARVLCPDGKPAAKFRVLSRSYIPSGWHLWQTRNWLEGRDGRFELPGCDPDKVVTAYLWDAKNKLGATTELSAKQNDDTMVRLEPCGKAELTCVDLDGKPLPGYRGSFSIVLDPGIFELPNKDYAHRSIEASGFGWAGYQADIDGKATLTNLIPGATYDIQTGFKKTKRQEQTWEVELYTKIDFTVKSGETKQLRIIDKEVVLGSLEGDKPVRCIDLGDKANHKLASFHKGVEGNNLAELKPGERLLMDRQFRIGDGLIQLANKSLKDELPAKVEGIKVDAKFARLHVLHATEFSAPDGTVIAKYVVRYEDKSSETIEVVYGKDVRDWWQHEGDKPPTRGEVVWKGSNDAVKAAGHSLWLFSLTWNNPHPDKKVASIDYVSTLTEAAPFLIALTVDEGPNRR
jgi:hypothetical protein